VWAHQPSPRNIPASAGYLIIFSGVNKSDKRFQIKEMLMDKNETGHLFLCKTTVATSDGLGTTLKALFIFYLWFCFVYLFDFKRNFFIPA